MVVALGREELVDREAHFLENVARIFRVGTAFLRRHTEVINGHQHLHVADELYDGENAERNHDDAAVGAVDEVAAVAVAQFGGDTTAVATFIVATVTAIDEACIQHDGLSDLHTAMRHIAGGHFLTVALVGAVFAVEDPHVTFAAVQNDLFAENADALHGGARHAVTAVHLDLYVKVEGQVAGIIPAVERQRLHVYVGRDDVCFFGADAVRVIDDHLIAFGEKQPHVFYTVFITTPDKINITVLPNRSR